MQYCSPIRGNLGNKLHHIVQSKPQLSKRSSRINIRQRNQDIETVCTCQRYQYHPTEYLGEEKLRPGRKLNIFKTSNCPTCIFSRVEQVRPFSYTHFRIRKRICAQNAPSFRGGASYHQPSWCHARSCNDKS